MNHAPSETEIDKALAYCEMHECIERGDLEGAMNLSKEHGIDMDPIWRPEDDSLTPRTNPIKG